MDLGIQKARCPFADKGCSLGGRGECMFEVIEEQIGGSGWGEINGSRCEEVDMWRDRRL